MTEQANTPQSAGGGILGMIQNCLKRRDSLYRRLVRLFGPVYGGGMKRSLAEFCRRLRPGMRVLNIGSGPYVLKEWPEAVNLDYFAFSNVDVVADALTLPFEDQSVDAVICTALLEHVAAPAAVVGEIQRVLKKGGEIICYCPFLVPYHAAPLDYHRWTAKGVEKLFKDFKGVTVRVGAGPTSALLWTFQEWLALVLSFGIRPLHDIILLCVMLVTWPIKFFDIFLERLSISGGAASGFVIQASKRS